jgi:hypothetical protein
MGRRETSSTQTNQGGNAFPGQSIADMLEAGATLQEIRGFIKNVVAPTSGRLNRTLNKWLHNQQPNDLAGKKELAEFINWLGQSFDSNLIIEDKPSYLGSSGGYGVPTGRFLITRVGANKPSATRVEAADLPHITFVSKERGASHDSPTGWSSREGSRRARKLPDSRNY